MSQDFKIPHDRNIIDYDILSIMSDCVEIKQSEHCHRNIRIYRNNYGHLTVHQIYSNISRSWHTSISSDPGRLKLLLEMDANVYWAKFKIPQNDCGLAVLCFDISENVIKLFNINGEYLIITNNYVMLMVSGKIVWEIIIQ